MRILVATPYLPWPLHSGGNAAQFSTLRCLANDHQFTVVAPIYTEEQKIHAQELAAQLPQIKVRAVFVGSSRPTSTPWPVRLLRRMAARARRTLARTRFPDSLANVATQPLPYYPFHPLSDSYIAALATEIQLGADLCQAEFAEMMPLGSWFPGTLPRIFVHHQIHAVYAERFANTYGHGPFVDYLACMMRTQEQAYLRKFDGVIALSEHDRIALEDFVPADRTFASPFPIPADVNFAANPASEWNGQFIFIGSEAHMPNQDALAWLLNNIWPRIAARVTNARLIVIGKWSTSWRQRCTSPAVEFLGFIENLATALHGGIMLVPLRVGSGIRTKIIVALAQGVPVVTTTVGGEGLSLSDGTDALIRDEPTAFAAAAVHLASTRQLWCAIAHAGMAQATRHFAPEQVRRRRNEIYAAISAAHHRPSDI